MKRYVAVFLCICMTIVLFIGCGSSQKGTEIKSINDISVNPFNRVKSGNGIYKQYDDARMKLIDGILKESSDLEGTLEKLDKKLAGERKTFTEMADEIEIADKSGLAGWLSDEMKLINDERISDEDMEFLTGVWGFYYSTALAQFADAAIISPPVTSADKSMSVSKTQALPAGFSKMGVSKSYLALTGFSVPFSIYSIEDAADLLRSAANSNGSLYDTITGTASQFAGQIISNASDSAKKLVSDFRTAQRAVSGTIGVIGKGAQLASVPIDAAYDSVFGTGQKWGVMGQTIDDLARQTEREIAEGRLGVSELRDTIAILDESTKMAGEVTGWLAETATNNKMIGAETPLSKAQVLQKKEHILCVRYLATAGRAYLKNMWANGPRMSSRL